MLLVNTHWIIACALFAAAFLIIHGAIEMITRIWKWIVYAYHWLRYEEWKDKK